MQDSLALRRRLTDIYGEYGRLKKNKKMRPRRAANHKRKQSSPNWEAGGVLFLLKTRIVRRNTTRGTQAAKGSQTLKPISD